ncbi:Fatty acid synthase, partial [Gonioctena quinquepunctata]
TAAGDPEECAGIDAVIARKRKTPLLVGSIKGNLGHSEPSSASSSVIKCILSMENGVLFPNIHYSVTSSTLDSIIEGRMKVVQEVTKIKDQMPLMGVNNFGFGGSNGHALMRAMARKKVNCGIPKDNLPRLVFVSGRTPEAVSSLLDTVNSETLDAEYISLLNNVFRTFIPNHRYAGYSIVSKTGVDKGSMSRITLKKLPIYLVFGNLEDWYSIYKQFSLIPIFADSIRRVQEFFEKNGTKINNTILNPDQEVRKSYVILGSLTIQLCLADVLKKICLPTTGVIGYSFGEFIRAYYDGDMDLETVLACGSILNGEPMQNYEPVKQKMKGNAKSSGSGKNTEKDLVDKLSSVFLKKINDGSMKDNKTEYLMDTIFNSSETKRKEIIQSDPLLIEVGENMLHEKYDWDSESFVFHSFKEFLHVLGKLYILGYHASIEKLYPMVDFPVSRGTPMIAPKIKWDHQRKFPCNFGETTETTIKQRCFHIHLLDKEWSFVTGHIIDGRNLFPASGYLVLTLQTLLGTRKDLVKYSVIFSNVRFIRATNISPDGSVTLNVNINNSGYFEIMEGDAPVVNGHVCLKPLEEYLEPLPTRRVECLMSTSDVYKELRLRGYNYSGEFNAIREIDVDATCAKIAWTTNLVTFMDNMFQMKILQEDSRLLYVPTTISKLTIANQYHEEEVGKFADPHSEEKRKKAILPVHYYADHDVIRGGGIEVQGLRATSIPRKKKLGIPVLEKYEFIPNHTELSTAQSVRVNAQIILENTLMTKIKSVEVIDDHVTESEEIISPILLNVLGDQPLIQGNVTIFSEKELDLDITVENKKLSKEDECVLVIATKLSERPEMLRDALRALIPIGYLISRETSDFNAKLSNSLTGLSVQTIHRNGRETLVLLRKSTEVENYISIDMPEDKQFTWLSEVQSAIETNQDVVIYSHQNPQSGLLGFINCLRREPEGDNVRCVLILDGEKTFDPNDESCAEQLRKGMAINIYEQGTWGTYRHLVLDQGGLMKSEHCYVAQTTRGDLSSFTWFEGPLSSSCEGVRKKIVKVHYSSLNFRDIMVATGRINVDAITTNRLEQDCGQGSEISGIDESGHRVMGMVPHSALGTLAIVDRHLIWRIPDDWSLADAASVPVVYGTVVHALTVRGRMKHGDSILIHSGTGGVGQAAIRYALFHGCTVYTTVSNQQKAEFLMKLFPQLTDEDIGNSRDQSFVKMIMRRTRGRGVDMVLNSLSEDKLMASVRCLARGGRFMEIGKYDLISNNSLNLILMNKEASFHGIVLEAIFDEQPSEKELLGQLVMKGIKHGSIKPLGCTIFKRNEIEQAYRYMTRGIHMGKVLIQVCEEESMRSDISDIEATPRYYCDPTKTYIIIGGLGGLGLELADWMVLRGARKLVLTSRGGLKNGYQRFRIKFWRRYGVVVKISTANIIQRDGCVQLISEAEKIGPIAAMFETSMSPKAYATKYLDEVSRSSCPELSEFVVFSSVSCGRGNPGQTNYGMANSVMERICEQRSRDGLPALVIQWGAVGEVGLVAEMREGHRELEISGTLQQRVSSCMEVMDLFLRQKSTTIVSSMVVAEKKIISNKASLTSTVLGIIGIMDDKLVSTQATLAELGMDSMNGVEIRQVLEREFDITLSSRELRTLTYGRLLELECKRNSQITEKRVTEVDIQLKDLMAILLPNELDDHSIVEMGGIVTGDQVPIVYFIAGIEGYSKSMQPLAQMLNARIFGLQYDDNNPSEDIVGMANHIYLIWSRTYPRRNLFVSLLIPVE